jgi:hypothetical protein
MGKKRSQVSLWSGHGKPGILTVQVYIVSGIVAISRVKTRIILYTELKRNKYSSFDMVQIGATST